MAIFCEILDSLGIKLASLLFVHASTDWLTKTGIAVWNVLPELKSRLASDGVLVMPAFPFVGHHEDFLRTSPTIDLKNTPARTGLLPEMLRREPEAARTYEPDLPCVVWGAESVKNRIIGIGPADEDGTGADSAFARIVEHGGLMLGLGVSHNYLALIHVFDSRFATQYTFPILSDETYIAHYKDGNANIVSVKRRAVPALLQQHIKPETIIAHLPKRQKIFKTLTKNGVYFFSWDIKRLEDWACEHIEKRLRMGKVPCWHEEYVAALEACNGNLN